MARYAAARGAGLTLSIGIDVGGTYTDLAAVGSDGAIEARKVLSTPADQSEGVAASLAELGAAPSNVRRIAHGTTVVTNLLLERRGARVVLCATGGATDLLELRRQDRAALYDLSANHPAPLVDADRVVPVNERITPRGVTVPLTLGEAARVADAVAKLAPEIVVVSLLHAYDDDSHERLLADAIRKRMPGVDVVQGADVPPEIREYERTTTAVAEGICAAASVALPRAFVAAARRTRISCAGCHDIEWRDAFGGARHRLRRRRLHSRGPRGEWLVPRPCCVPQDSTMG